MNRDVESEVEPSRLNALAGREMSGRTSLKAQREMLLAAQEEATELERQSRECPVPKPKGWVGSILGFSKDEGAVDTEAEKRRR